MWFCEHIYLRCEVETEDYLQQPFFKGGNMSIVHGEKPTKDDQLKFITSKVYTVSYKETGFPPAIWECVKSYSIGQPDRVMLFKPTITCYHGVFQPLSRVIAGFRAIESRVIIFSSASLVLGCFKHRYVRTHSPLPTLPWRSTFTPSNPPPGHWRGDALHRMMPRVPSSAWNTIYLQCTLTMKLVLPLALEEG